jgi:hypothetical protein
MRSGSLTTEYRRVYCNEGCSAQGPLCVRSKFYGQATKGARVDALAQVGDEGRGQLR